MVDLSELHAQNHKITEISNVYLFLVKKRTLCDSEIASRLLFDYADRIGAHLEQVDRRLTTPLLSAGNSQEQNLARKFLTESTFLKRLVGDYLSRWTDKKARRLVLKDHNQFLKDTQEIFDLVLDRIQRETEHLYPLAKGPAAD